MDVVYIRIRYTVYIFNLPIVFIADLFVSGEYIDIGELWQRVSMHKNVFSVFFSSFHKAALLFLKKRLVFKLKNNTHKF